MIQIDQVLESRNRTLRTRPGKLLLAARCEVVERSGRARRALAAFSPTPSTEVSSSGAAWSTPCSEPKRWMSRWAVSLVSCRGMA